MAQETIRVDCIESVYMDKGNKYGNQGKTPELLIYSTNSKYKYLEIQDLALLQFNIPDEIKKYKIVSVNFCFNAIVESSYNQLYEDYRTEFYLLTSPGILVDPNADIYQAKYSDYAEYDNFLGEDSVIGSGFPVRNLDLWKFHQNYPNYTNLTLPFLQTNFESSQNPEGDKTKTWDAFLEFLNKRKILIAIWRTASTSLGLDNTYSKVTMQSSRTNNAPYLEVIVDNEYLYIVAKTQGFTDTSKSFVLSWAYEPTRYIVDPQVTQKSAEVRIRKKGEESYQTYSVEGNTLFAEIPGQQFSEESYEWQVYAESDDGRIGTSEWVEITTTDAISDATVIYPDQVVIDGSQPVRLEWEHVISTGSLPRGFDVQYHRDGYEWQDLVEQKNTDAQYYDLPGNTLPSGNVEWRVRTYNSNLVAGNWSDPGVVIVRGASPAPIITQITTQPRPTITWEAEGQIMAQIRIGDIVKTLYSAAKTYKWPDFLPDGPVMVEVRVQNEFGLWSQWGSMTVTIKNQAQEPVAISARIINYSASLSVVSSYPNNYIYRDGVLLGKVSQVDDILSYIDYESVGKHNYQAMGVDEQDNYQMSNMITVTVSLDCGMIGQAQSPEWIMLKRRRGSFPAHSIKTKKPVSLIYYQGKSLPVAHVSESLEVEHTLEFTVDKSTADQLQKLIGENIIYKDVRGDLIVGVMSGIECSRDRSTDVKITIDETQKEVIEIA